MFLSTVKPHYRIDEFYTMPLQIEGGLNGIWNGLYIRAIEVTPYMSVFCFIITWHADYARQKNVIYPFLYKIQDMTMGHLYGKTCFCHNGLEALIDNGFIGPLGKDHLTSELLEKGLP